MRATSTTSGSTGSGPRGALYAVELRDGRAVSFLERESEADAGVFWHAGSVLALPEAGLPSRYSRFLEPQEFAGGLTVPIASHVHRVAADGSRVLFSVDDGVDRAVGGGAQPDSGAETEGVWLRLGEWDVTGALRSAQSVELERATWQHDVGVTANHVVFIESPTTRLAGSASSVPFGWVPGAETWVGVVARGDGGGGDGGSSGGPVRWFRLDPCLVTHVLGAWETDGPGGGEESSIQLLVCVYPAPEVGQPFDLSAPVVGPDGIGLTAIGGGLGVLERWRITGDRIERVQVDERHVEYPRMDARCEGAAFRYGYAIEVTWGESVVLPGAGAGGPAGARVSPGGPAEVRPATRRGRPLASGPRAQGERADLRPCRGRSQRRRGLGADRGRRRQSWCQRSLCPGRLVDGAPRPRGDHPPAQCDCLFGATASGCPRTAIAERVRA